MGVKIHQAVLVVSSSKRRKTVIAAKDASTYYCVKAVNAYVHVFFLFLMNLKQISFTLSLWGVLGVHGEK